jgi:hypothetical protein
VIRWLLGHIWRGDVSEAWMRQNARRESCEGMDNVRIWLKSEAHQKHKAEVRRRIQTWRSAKARREA